jgi:uncharacterized protein YbaR (Trm112 family)
MLLDIMPKPKYPKCPYCKHKLYTIKTTILICKNIVCPIDMIIIKDMQTFVVSS